MCSMDNHRIRIKIKFGYTIFILKMRNPLTLKIDNCSGDASGMQENDFDVTTCTLVTFTNYQRVRARKVKQSNI